MSSITGKHPKGLPFLFLTEMWERFGYYLMIGIFVLYMTDTKSGGLAFDRKNAADIYGTFIAFVYLTPFIGGMLADRLLGYRRAIVIGGILMGLGYIGLALPGMTAFYASLFLIILGNGFFKPNISTLLGNLYNQPEYKLLKDSGYNIFYMGINIGAFICNFFATYLRHNFGWGAAFAAAGVGMFIGVFVFWLGWKNYEVADVRKASAEDSQGVGRQLSSILIPALISGIIGWMIPGNIFGSDSTDAFLLGALPIIYFYISLLWKAPIVERRPISALLAIYGVVIIFWAVFKQNGTALTTWAEFYTDREIPAAIEPATAAINMVQHAEMKLDSFPVYDSQFRTTKVDGKIVKNLSNDPYFLNIPETERPPTGQGISLISTELYQSINPFFVIIFTPLVVGFFAWLRRKGKEPTTPAKIAWGLVISALSTLVMVAACYACHNGIEKASSWWMVGTYGIVTLGELCLSPMGLSLVSKLSPMRITGLMMGGWQLATSLGNKLSGILATLWDDYDNKADFFWLNFGLLTIASITLFLMLRWLNKVFKEQGLT